MITKKRMQTLCGSLLLGSVAGLSVPAYANNAAMMELLEILRERGSITQDEYRSLKNAATADKEKTEALKDDVEKKVAEATKDIPKVNLTERLEFQSQDGNFRWKVGGRIHADAVFIDSDNIDRGNATNFRRARLEVDGTLWKVWQTKIQYDFTGSGRDGIRDMYIRYAGWDNAHATVGHFKVPFSLEELTSSNNITFMERSLANAPVSTLLSRQVGVGASTQFNDMFTLHGMLYSTNGPASPSDETINEGWGIGGRGTFAPINDGTRLVHLGVAGTYMDANEDGVSNLRLRQRPEIGFGTRIVDTGALGGGINGVKDVTMIGGEAAFMYGPASLQGEYIVTNVNRGSGLSSPTFDGFYVQGSYILTGESRRYSFGSGSFGNPRPNAVVGRGGWGAWELALRYSNLNLNDSGILGGKVDNITAGINWYPTGNLRFMANYVNVLKVNDGPFANDEPSAFMLRAQVAF